MCHDGGMDTETNETIISEADGPLFVKGVVQASLSGAQMLADWKENGCFEVWADQYKDIGPGKKYADSTEYVNAMREQAAKRSAE